VLTGSASHRAALNLVPNYAGIELEHMSHADQHFPPHETNYGSELADVFLEWGGDPNGGPYLILSEGIDLDPCRGGYCGEIAGPREQFQARLGYRFKIH